MREGTVVAEYLDPWEARLARDTLAEAGLEAWLEGPQGPMLAEESGRLRLVVPPDAVGDAREVLGDLEPSTEATRPRWIAVVAGVVAAGMIWAAVPRFLWPWILLVAFVGFLLWRAAGPRRT